MKETYAKALHFVLLSEGGFSDDPGDNGGATNKGITWHDLAAYRHRSVGDYPNDATQRVLVKSMTDAEMEAIYRKKYWENNLCDYLPFPLDMMVFDLAVNAGAQGARLLWKAVGKDPQDRITPALVKIILNEGTHLTAVVENYFSLRVDFYHAIGHGHNAAFLHGWLNRVAALRKAVAAK